MEKEKIILFINNRLKEMNKNKVGSFFSDYTTDELIIKWETLRKAYKEIENLKDDILNKVVSNKNKLSLVEESVLMGYKSALGLIAIEMNSIVAFIGTRLEKVGIIKDFELK